MPKRNPKVDAYIEKAPEYARPILTRLRSTYHKACPTIEEEIKWGIPHFMQHGIVGGMAAFKKHVGWGFWKGKQMKDPEALFTGAGKATMSMVRAERVADLPSQKVLIAYIQEAVKINEAAAAAPKAKTGAKKAVKKTLVVRAPADLAAALKRNAKAKATYDGFPPSKKRDYVEWLTTAKKEETRTKRLKQAVAWMAEGKSRHWKYENC